MRVRDSRKTKSVKPPKGLAASYLQEPVKKSIAKRSSTPERDEKPKKPKRKPGHFGAGGSSGINDLQSVEEFRHFLLANDSSFSTYISNPLVLGLFDSHLMRESMISIMA